MVDELLNDTMLVVWDRAARYNGQSKVPDTSEGLTVPLPGR